MTQTMPQLRNLTLKKYPSTINGDPFHKELNRSIINPSTSTVQLSDRKIIRKSEIAIPKSNSTKIRPVKGNISFTYFTNNIFEVGQKHESSRRQSKPRKPQPRTRKQVEIGPSDNLTRTRVSRPSSKSTRRQTRQSKKTTTPQVILLRMNPRLFPRIHRILATGNG